MMARQPATAGLRRRPPVRPRAAPGPAARPTASTSPRRCSGHAAARTDASTGEVTVRFALNDSVTASRPAPAASTTRGALGAAAATVESVQPFYVEPKLPLEVTAGRPHPAAGEPGQRHRRSALRAAEVKASGSPARCGSRPCRRSIWRRASGPGSCWPSTWAPAQAQVELQLEGRAGPFADTVVRKLAIKPGGFPIELAHGGLTVKDGAVGARLRDPRPRSCPAASRPASRSTPRRWPT